MKTSFVILGIIIITIVFYGYYHFMTNDFPPNPEAVPDNVPENELPEQTSNPLQTSRKIIDTILDDVSATYPLIPGGGIGSINQDSTYSYSIRLLREEAVDVITYTVSVDDDGFITITDKVSKTE